MRTKDLLSNQVELSVWDDGVQVRVVGTEDEFDEMEEFDEEEGEFCGHDDGVGEGGGNEMHLPSYPERDQLPEQSQFAANIQQELGKFNYNQYPVEPLS